MENKILFQGDKQNIQENKQEGKINTSSEEID